LKLVSKYPSENNGGALYSGLYNISPQHCHIRNFDCDGDTYHHLMDHETRRLPDALFGLSCMYSVVYIPQKTRMGWSSGKNV
jgi:hypothetical protein